MDALIGISTVVGVVIVLTILIRFIIMRISKSQNFSLYSWITSGIIGTVFLFFVVLAQIKAAEAQKMIEAVQKVQVEALKNAEEATKNAEEANRQMVMAKEAQREAEKQAELLYECEGKK